MRILIVEDHMMFREVLRKVCIKECHFEVVGETGSGSEAIKIVQSTRPDLLLLDIALSDLDGFAVAQAAMAAAPSIRILFLSGILDDRVLAYSDKLRIHGFIDKNDNSVAALKSALLAVGAGRSYFSPAFRAAKDKWHVDSGSVAKRLSAAEQAVLSLIALGLSNEEIGLQLSVTPKTAQSHRSSILRRLDIPGTPKLMAYAIGKGFGRGV